MNKYYYICMPKWAKNYSPPFGWYNYAYYFTCPWKYVAHIAFGLKYFYQRGRYGYSEQDVWGLDWYLAHWLPKALRELKDQSHGYPVGQTPNRWGKKLEIMAQGFEAAQQVQDYTLDKKQIKVFKRGMKLFSEHFFSLWD